MNLKLLIKSIFFSCCFVLIATMQRNLDTFVLATDTIAPEKYLDQLSTQEQIQLEQGKVVLKGQKGNYVGQILTRGNIDTAWEVVTDYNNFEQFLPNIASSQVISESGDRKIFEQVNVVDLWLFTEKFTVQIEANETKPQNVKFQQHQGDLKYLKGIWQLEQLNPNQILVTHTVEVEPGSNTEKPFFYGVYESSLETTLEAIAKEITKRSSR